jgi:hypothetical protein
VEDNLEFHAYLVGFASEFQGFVLRLHIPPLTPPCPSWSQPGYFIQILGTCAIGGGQYEYSCIHHFCELRDWVDLD